MSRIVKSLLARELVLLKYKLDKALLFILSSLTTIFILTLVLGKDQSENFILSLLIVSSTLTIGISDHTGIQDDFKTGVLEQMYLLPIPNLQVTIVRWLSASIQYVIVNVPLCMVLYFCISREAIYQTLAVYFLFILNLSNVSILINTICIGIKRNKGLLPSILTVPILLPQVILSIISLQNYIYLLLIIALSVIMIPLCLVFSNILIKSIIKECG